MSATLSQVRRCISLCFSRETKRTREMEKMLCEKSTNACIKLAGRHYTIQIFSNYQIYEGQSPYSGASPEIIKVLPKYSRDHSQTIFQSCRKDVEKSSPGRLRTRGTTGRHLCDIFLNTFGERGLRPRPIREFRASRAQQAAQVKAEAAAGAKKSRLF